MRMGPVIAAPLPSASARECLERSEAVGCLSLVMTPDCINGACLFVLSSTAAGRASQANRDRVMETTAKDVAVRAMAAATVTPLTPMWLLAFVLFFFFFVAYIAVCPLKRGD